MTDKADTTEPTTTKPETCAYCGDPAETTAAPWPTLTNPEPEEKPSCFSCARDIATPSWSGW